jgi:hypothetical protein
MRVQVLNETTLDAPAEEYRLFYQWGRYLYDDGTLQHGYRYIWKHHGALLPSRGQARIPSADVQLQLIQIAKDEGWGDYVDSDFDLPKPANPKAQAEA